MHQDFAFIFNLNVYVTMACYFASTSVCFGSIVPLAAAASSDVLDRLNSFLIGVDNEPFSLPSSSWQTYTAKTKKKYFTGMQEMMCKVATILFGSEKEEVLKEFYTKMADSDPVETSSSVCDETTDALIATFNSAESWQIKRQVLSVLSVSRTYQELKVLLPDVTKYRYYAAKKHASLEGCCMPPPEKEDIRQRMDPVKLDSFLEFITSSHIVKDLPYGQRKIRTSKGKIIETPNIIRCMAPQAIINQYLQYCNEQELVPLGTSTMFRILQTCTATIRRSLEGLDYYLAEGGRSFEDLIDIVYKLEKDGERAKQLHDVLLGAKRYLKNDFKVHVAETSDVADHCRKYALSDSSTHFSTQCDHNHDRLCEACEQVKDVLKDVKQLLDRTDFAQREDKDDITFRLRHAETSISNWKSHLIRARNQEEAKHNIFQSLSVSSACIVLDWAMKFLPRKYREDTQDWFGKRGISWHISVAFTKQDDILKSLTFVHIFEGQICQDATVTSAVILDVVASLQKQYSEIETVHLWSDNAGCYKSSETISTLHHFCQPVASYDFCEAQDGKGACDRTAAVIKSTIRRYVNEGHDVVTAQQMKQAIETTKCVHYKVKVVELEAECRQKFTPIPSISQYNNFKYLDGEMKAWRHFGIGAGKTIPGSALDKIQPATLRVLKQANDAVEFHEIGRQKKTQSENQDIFTCEREGCVATFKTSKELDDHLIVGDCDLKVQKENTSDLVIEKYVKILHEENREEFTLQCDNRVQSGSGESTLKQGWGLKEDRKNKRFSKKQKDYLEEKFKSGLKSGRKEDPVTVSEEMRRLTNADGGRVFSYDELLTSQQIASFFSRMCKKSRSYVTETMFDKLHEIV